jgi:hypothetical protein
MVTIVDNAPSNGSTDRQIALSGFADNSAVALTPATMVFGSQPVNTGDDNGIQPSAPQTATLLNNGSADLTLTSVTVLNGAYPGSACSGSATPLCNFTIQPTSACTAGASVPADGSSCNLDIRSSAPTLGLGTGVVVITDSNGGTHIVALTGFGTSPWVTFDSPNVSFGSENLGSAFAEPSVTLSNDLASFNLTLNSISAVGGIGFDPSNTCAAGSVSSCTLGLTFTPTVPGLQTDLVVVTDGVGNGSEVLVVGGTGSGAAVSLSSSELTFPPTAVGVTSEARTLTLINSGNEPLSISAINFSSDFAENMATTTCSTTSQVAAGTPCTIGVTFTPTTGGPRTGALTITDNAGGSPQTVSLTGTGVNPVPAESSLSPSSATAGGAAFTLTVTGKKFVSTSTVDWNGVGLTTKYVSSTHLTASVPASDIAAAGKATVTVTNPSPGGGTSSALTFTINPSIAISSVIPGSIAIVQGGSAKSVTVRLTRNGFSGSVTLAASNLPGGVTPTYTQPGTGNSGSISFKASSSATLVSNQTITVKASGSGVTSVTSTFNLTVNPPSIAISKVSPTSITLARGGSAASVTVTLTRTGFTGSVTLAVSTLPHGVTATIRQPGTGTSGTISLKASSSATVVGGQTITIKASGSGVTSVTATFSLTT